MRFRLPSGLRARLLPLVALSLLPALGLVVYDAVVRGDATLTPAHADGAREAVVFVTSAISFALAWLVSNATIVRPVRQILRATRRIADGDLSARVGVHGGSGEIESLAKAFDEMAASLERRRQDGERTAQQLRDERDYISHIITLTPALVCGIAPDGATTFVNPAVEEATGYRAADLIGRNWWTTFYPGESYAQVERLFRDLEAGSVRDYEMDLTAANGELRRVSWTSLNREDRAGNIVEVIGFGVDVTERTRAARERDRLEIELRRAHKLEAMGQLAAGIAHEINTPMQYTGDNMRFLGESFATLEQLVHVLQRLLAAHDRGDVPPAVVAEARETLETTDLAYLVMEIPNAICQSLDGVERVSRIVRAMKEFSHPGSEEPMPIDLNRALESTITVATNEWKYVANLVMDFDEQLPPVPARAGELNQAFLNLIVNAAHAIGDVVERDGTGKGVITIGTRAVDGWAEIRVEDTGTGIPPAIRERIFDPFFTTKPPGKGSGQGLPICHSVIVDRHGGTITFEPGVGGGTVFIVRLPLTPVGLDGASTSALELVG
jgi:PAS domain S-box-containing protein